jgi:hypothetical protein
MTTKLHPVSRLKMIGAIFLIPPYAFVVWKAMFSANIIREDEMEGIRGGLETGTNVYHRDR